MKLHRLRSHAEFCEYRRREAGGLRAHQDLLKSLTPPDEQPFTVDGYSYVAGTKVAFEVDFQWSGVKGQVNWRDRVRCPASGLTARWRATIQLFDIEVEAFPDSEIYLTEQVAPLYHYFSRRFSRLIGSEYLGPAVALGQVNASGVRNEDLGALSFADCSLDVVLSYDVIEHVAQPLSAFRECHRVLRPGGWFHWTVPFSPESQTNSVRALMEGGQVRLLFPPEYHGNPLSEEGSLCFTHFGWQMLDDVRSVGFRDVYAIAFYSPEFGYYGEQFQFFAVK